MAQVALADSLQLPPDSTGKRTGMFKVNLAGTDVYLPASVLTDTAGNAIDSATAAPAGTERGLITRNIPSGTQPVSGTVNIGTAPQVAVNNVETIADNAAFVDGTSKLFPQGYVFDEVAGTALTENDIAAARVDSKRAIVNVLEDATTRGRRAIISAAGGLLGDQGAPAVQANSWFVRPRKLVTYRAVFRAAAAPYQNSVVHVANTRKQWATIHHAATATKTVRIRGAWFIISGNNLAALINVDLVRITAAPATGNPAITPSKASSADGAVEATCLNLPTTAGTEEAQVYSMQAFNAGVIAGGTTTNAAEGIKVNLLRSDGSFDDETKPPEIRAGVLEGWAVTVTTSAANTLSGYVEIEFTEE